MDKRRLYELAKILVTHVQTTTPEQQTVTYGQVSKKFGGMNPRNLNGPLGQLCVIAKESDFPAISAIVVNQGTHMPGEGFYEYVGEIYTGRKLPPNEWEGFWKEQIQQIYSRSDWDGFLGTFFR